MPHAVRERRQPVRLLQPQAGVHDAVSQPTSMTAWPTAVLSDLACEHPQRRPILEYFGRNSRDAGRECRAAQAIEAAACAGPSTEKREQGEAMAIWCDPVHVGAPQ